MRNKLINFWNNLDNDRKDVLISCVLVVIIALAALPFIPAKEPGYFPLTVLISQFLVNSLLMSWKIKVKKSKSLVLDKRSGKFFSAKKNWFLVVYPVLMFAGFAFTIALGFSLFAFTSLVISRSYLYINKLPLTAMNLFFLTSKPSKSEYNFGYAGYANYSDYLNNSPTCRNVAGNIYHN